MDVADDGQGAGIVPRLRFPEFRGTGGWGRGPLGDFCEVMQGYGFPEEFQGRTDGRYPFCKVSDISRAVEQEGGKLSSAANYVEAEIVRVLRATVIPVGATVFARIGEAIRSNRRALVMRECLVDNNAVAIKSKLGRAQDFFVFLLSQRIDMGHYSAGVVPSVNKSTLEAIPLVVPSLGEQQRIADCLSSLNDLIVSETRKVDALKTHKMGLVQQLFPREGETVPRLRFPEFVGEWECTEVGELISTIAPPKKLATGAYLHEGSFPILDQGKESVAGWTNDETALVAEEGPLIVFGDHTCKVVLARQPFAQGADGIKILRTRDRVSTEFLYQALLHRPIASSQYRRHFSILRERKVCFPSTVAEQQRITDFLSCLDGLIVAEARRLDALKAHKKGLMQQLFPQEAAEA